MALEWLLGEEFEDFFESPVYFYFVIIFLFYLKEKRKKKLCRSILTIIKSPKNASKFVLFIFTYMQSHLLNYFLQIQGLLQKSIYVTAAVEIKWLIINISMVVMKVLYMYIEMITSAKSVWYSYQMLYGVRLGKSLHFNELFTF